MNKKLQLVLEKADRDKQKLAERLQKALSFLGGEEQQMAQLKSYESDYEKKINSQKNVQSAENISRYRSFYHQLNQLMGEQQRKIIIAQQQVSHLRQSLLQQQQKMKVLAKLAKEQQQQDNSLEEKQLQKQIDDLSAQAAHKRSR